MQIRYPVCSSLPQSRAALSVWIRDLTDSLVALLRSASFTTSQQATSHRSPVPCAVVKSGPVDGLISPSTDCPRVNPRIDRAPWGSFLNVLPHSIARRSIRLNASLANHTNHGRLVAFFFLSHFPFSESPQN